MTPRPELDSTPFFLPDGDGFVPTRFAKGPWGDTVSGNRVGGLLAWGIERDAGGDGNLGHQPARLTVDLLRPTAMAPVQVRTNISRDGRRLRLIDAELTQKGAVVARASALYLLRSEQPPDEVWSTPIAMPALPAEPEELPDGMPMFIWTYGTDLAEGALGLDQWQQATNPKYAWVRDTLPIIADQPLTPFIRAAMAGDVVSSLTHWGTGGLKFINADYTLTFSRLPAGSYIGLAALTHYSHAGIAAGAASMFDRDGPIGSATCTALAHFGFRP